MPNRLKKKYMTLNSIREFTTINITIKGVLIQLTMPWAPGPTEATDHSVGYASTLHSPATTLLYAPDHIQ